MPWSWRRTGAWWSASWLTASLVAAALALAPADATLARLCDPGAEGAPYYPVIFTGTVESVSDQHETSRRPGLPPSLPSWVPFSTQEGAATVRVVRFQASVRYRGDVHRHEAVQWLAGGRPRAGARYTVFATVVRDHLETDPCAPNTQVHFDAQRYGLVAQPPFADPEPFAGWQLGAAAVAVLLGLAGLAAWLLGRRSRQPR
jgi:hypothetical protein